jgi:hypothetical protein
VPIIQCELTAEEQVVERGEQATAVSSQDLLRPERPRQ